MATQQEKQLNRSALIDAFCTYCLEHHEHHLLRILEESADRASHVIKIDFMILCDANPLLSKMIISEPLLTLKLFESGAGNAFNKLNLQSEKPIPFKEGSGPFIRISVKGLPEYCPELFHNTLPHCDDIGKFLTITGIIIRATAPSMADLVKMYTCTFCGLTFAVEADFEQFYVSHKPTRCRTDDCKGNQFILNESSSSTKTCIDYQEIKVQEQVQCLSMGKLPRSMWVALHSDLVDSCKPGDEVLVTGVLRQRWRSFYRDAKPEVELVFDASYVKIVNKQRIADAATDKRLEQISAFWDQYRNQPLTGRDAILACFCPQVFGLYIVKLAMAVVLAGGVCNTVNGTRVRGEPHMLLIGDPGTAKSQLLKYAARLSPRSVMTSGSGTTSAGLTVAAVKEGGSWSLEAGALVLSDMGVCCIDEFNSLKEHDKASIHEAMEQQTINVAKAGLVCELNTRCSVLAAANPKGTFDPALPMTVNLALASPLLSRFDLILLLGDTKNSTWDEFVADSILKTGLINSTASTSPIWSMEDLRSYLIVVKSMFRPVLGESAEKVLRAYYHKQRAKPIDESPTRTTARLLESLIRLAQGHARLMFRNEVTVQDAIIAVCLMETSILGGVLARSDNVLHTAFPRDPDEEYLKQVEIILGGLDMSDLLLKEVQRCYEEGERNRNGRETPILIQPEKQSESATKDKSSDSGEEEDMVMLSQRYTQAHRNMMKKKYPQSEKEEFAKPKPVTKKVNIDLKKTEKSSMKRSHDGTGKPSSSRVSDHAVVEEVLPLAAGEVDLDAVTNCQNVERPLSAKSFELLKKFAFVKGAVEKSSAGKHSAASDGNVSATDYESKSAVPSEFCDLSLLSGGFEGVPDESIDTPKRVLGTQPIMKFKNLFSKSRALSQKSQQNK